MAWLWAKLFGSGAVGLRSLSALLGTATVPLAYRLALDVAGRRAALLAAALVACNPLLVWYSQEARAYALLVLLALATVVVWVRLLEAPRARRVAVWAVCCAAALATHYFALFVIVPEAAALSWVHRDRMRVLLPALAGVVLVAAALAPLALHQRANDHAAFIRDTPLARRVVQLPKQWLVGYDAPLERPLAVASALVLAVGLALLLMRGEPRERRGALVVGRLGVASVLLPVALAVAGADYLVSRNAIGSLAPLLVVAGVGFAGRGAGRTGAVLAGALCATWVWVAIAVAADPRYQRDDWRGVAHALGPPPPGGRVLVVTPDGGVVPLALYLPGARWPTGPASAQEVDVVAMGLHASSGARTLPARVPVPAPAGFTPLRPRVGSTWLVARFAAPGAAPVDLGAALAHPLEPGQSAALVQPHS